MAKVEMSLSEYNAIKEELDFLHRVVKEITTPVVDTWTLDYYGKMRANHSVSAKISDEVKAYLESQAMSHIPTEYSTPDFSIEPNFSNPNLITANYVELDPEEPTEEEAEV